MNELDIDRLDDEFANRMAASNQGDNEEDHMTADDLLCELLDRIGFKSVIEEYRKIGKWYA